MSLEWSDGLFIVRINRKHPKCYEIIEFRCVHRVGVDYLINTLILYMICLYWICLSSNKTNFKTLSLHFFYLYYRHMNLNLNIDYRSIGYRKKLKSKRKILTFFWPAVEFIWSIMTVIVLVAPTSAAGYGSDPDILIGSGFGFYKRQDSVWISTDPGQYQPDPPYNHQQGCCCCWPFFHGRIWGETVCECV